MIPSAVEALHEDAAVENVEGSAGKSNGIIPSFYTMKFVLCTYVFKCSSSCLVFGRNRVKSLYLTVY